MVGNQQNKLEMFLDVQWDYIPINSSQIENIVNKNAFNQPNLPKVIA